MKPILTLLCLAPLTLLIPACLAGAPDDDAADDTAELVGEDTAELTFHGSDRDLNWAGTASYGAGWAASYFAQIPGIYLYQAPAKIRGAIYLSPSTQCKFQSYTETASTVTFTSQSCSGPRPTLQVSLTCAKQAAQRLACNGTVGSPGGQQSSVTAILYESICAPDGCYDGPKEPVPPQPDNSCPTGQSYCSAVGCCPPGQRCGDSKCWTPEQGDEVRAMQGL